jgi:hypothetical protein
MLETLSVQWFQKYIYCSASSEVATLSLDLPCCGPVTHSGKILTTGKSHRKKLDRFSLNDNMDMNMRRTAGYI